MRFSNVLICGAVYCLATGAALAQDTLPLPFTAATVASTPATLKKAIRSMGLAGAVRHQDAPPARPAVPALPPNGFYPADLSNPANLPAVVTAQQHLIYINKPASHWGDPATFLSDLGKSQFIHLLDQYIGSYQENRYTVGTSFRALYPGLPHTLTENDVLGLVYAAASVAGRGFGHVYHVFIPQGTDECVTQTECYSPDNFATFAFCAYHGAVIFSDAPTQEVLFTVEPYQNAPGCAQAPSDKLPNGPVADSTNSTLSHETFETLSDPDLSEWWVQDGTFANGNEIGDLCSHFGFFGNPAVPYFNDGTVRLNGHLYVAQAEYSNQYHGCAYGPAFAGQQ